MPDRTKRLDEALEALCAADVVTRPGKAQALLSLVPPVLRGRDGAQAVFARATRFDACGGFSGTPWDRPAHLRARLWAGSFDADAPYPWFEVLSTLRMLAVAVGEAVHQDVDAAEARRFLERVLSLNLDKVLEAGSEAHRIRRVRHHDAASLVLRFVLARLPQSHFLEDVAREVDDIMSQRPVWTHHVRATIRLVSAAPGADGDGPRLLSRYVEAVLGPSPMTMRFREPAAYADALPGEGSRVPNEAELLGKSMRATGLTCRQHAALAHHVADDATLLGAALGLDDRGQAVLDAHGDLVARLVAETVHPDTAQTLYGLARVLERGLLERPEVVRGLETLLGTEVQPDLATALQTGATAELSPAALLAGGAIRVLGQPLGVGQGNNPTCQAARGISLWAQYRPAHLLDVLAGAAREGDVAMAFESYRLHSRDLADGLVTRLDPDLDPVSLALVPHLDRLYDAMMKLAAGRDADPHKWVNPALYGSIVPHGFASCFHPATFQVWDHAGFVRTFMAAFHPDHNDGREPVYAAPTGIAVTDDRGRLLGLHAITLQRVAADRDGKVRVYFYNPNNEGRQDWGDGVQPSVRRHGELEGECSLPIAAFASRVYGFHHPDPLPGDPASVPADLVERVTRMVKRTWGRSYAWAEMPAPVGPV